MTSFTEGLREAAGAGWEASLGHRFFREVAGDSMADSAFQRYLRVEYGFVDTAAQVLGYAVAKAPSFTQRRRLSLGLYGLVTDQQDYFMAAFEDAAVPPDLRTALPPDKLSAPLHDLFLETAKAEGYEEILACILGAEWLYLTWCSLADATPSCRKHLRDWVALHAHGSFAEHVAWVRAELDARGPGLSAERQIRLRQLFASVLIAEMSFHDAAYAAM
jgi:thiaminase (transcriptional activator TenA)